MSFFGIPMRNGLSLGLGTVASLTNGPGFLPDELFYGGTVQGAWYDPSDLTTLFQDSAGTTPVTAVEQAVGLMLDKSKGLVLGSEVIAGGDFSGGLIGSKTDGFGSVSTWTLNTTNPISGTQDGRLVITTGSSSGRPLLVWLGTTVVGKTYLYSFDYKVNSGALIIGDINSGGALVTVSRTLSGSGKFQAILTATGTANFGALYFGNSLCDVQFDNISVRELPGNHAYQSTSASRPTLRARYNLLTYSEDFTNAAWTKLGATTAPSANTINFPNLNEAILQGATVTATVGTSARFSVELSGTGTLYIGCSRSAGGVYEETRVLVTLTSTPTRYTVSHTIANASQTGFSGFITRGVDGTATTVTANRAQLAQTAVFPSNTYQRIGAATDYATGAAFPPYLFFDGTDDSMLTNSVDFATVTSDGRARRNLLTLPTEFNVTPPWTIAAGVTVTPNVDTAPDGTLSADRIVFTGVSQDVYQELTLANTQYVGSYYVKAGSAGEIGKTIAIGIGNSTNGFTDQLITLTANWQRITATRNVNSGTTCRVGVHTFAGATALNVIVWGAQLETGSTATAFQNIGTDKMLVVAGVTKSSDAARGMLLEIGPATTPRFAIEAPTSAAANYGIVSGGTVLDSVGTSNSYAAPLTNVLTGTGNIAAPSVQLRVNGVLAASASATQGTGNYGNQALYIGRRNNATLPFNGNLYSLIIAGQSYSSGQISSTESWVAAKTPLGTI